MKVKSWPIIMKVFAVISLVLAFSLVSCTKSTEEGSDDLSIFNKKAKQILLDSLIDMPLSLLKDDRGASNDKSMKNIAVAANINEFGDNDNVNMAALNFYQLDPFADTPKEQTRNYGALYDVARNYVSVAAEVKAKIEMFIVQFIGNLGKLKDVDIPLTLPDYVLGEGSQFYKVVINAAETAEYTWKIELYYAKESLEPETVFFLSLSEEGGKGRMFMEMEHEKDEYAAAVGISGLELTKKVEATFNGMQNPKTFEIKYIGDRTEARNYAKQNWVTFPHNATGDAIKDALTKIPEKIFLTAKYYTGKEEWDVYGASYHPGWALLEELTGKAFWNDASRTIYSFKAKSVKSEAGAKLALALPQETSIDPDAWKKDSVESVFVTMVMGQLNYSLNKLNDDVNDYPPDFSTCDDPCYDPPNTPPLYAGRKEAEKYKATAMYDCIMFDCSVSHKGDSLPPNPISVTQVDLKKFVSYPPVHTELFPKVKPLHDQCSVISYMVNPVFFRVDNGLVGSYNATTKKFYKYTYITKDDKTKTGEFGLGTDNIPLIGNLIDISLDNIGSYIPRYIRYTDINP